MMTEDTIRQELPRIASRNWKGSQENIFPDKKKPWWRVNIPTDKEYKPLLSDAILLVVACYVIKGKYTANKGHIVAGDKRNSSHMYAPLSITYKTIKYNLMIWRA